MVVSQTERMVGGQAPFIGAISSRGNFCIAPGVRLGDKSGQVIGCIFGHHS
jgi:hypothetical protein